MRGGTHFRYSLPFVLGVPITAVALGAAISLVAAGTFVRGAAVVLGGILMVGLAISAGPAAVAKGRALAASLRWWHWLWLLVFLSGLVFRIRDIGTIQAAPVDASAAWRIGLMGLVALVLLSRLAYARPDWVPALVRGLPSGIFLCTLISLVSTLWSVYPIWTLYKSLEFLIDLALLAAVVTSVSKVEDLKSLFDWTWVLCGLFQLTVWLGVLFRPDLAIIPGIGLIGFQIQGVLPIASANAVGDGAAILLIVAATRLLFRRRHRQFYWAVCLVAIPTLLIAQSRSPVTGAVLALIAAALLARRFGLLVVVGLAALAGAALTSMDAVVQEAFLRGQNPTLFYSLSGRVGWWAVAWEVFRQHPFLGLGGYAGARFAVLAALGVTDISSIHNGWLEILLGVGLVGFIPVVATFVGMWFALLGPLDPSPTPSLARELRVEGVAIFVLVCVRSFFTVEFTWHPPILFFLVLAQAELLRRARLQRTLLAPAAAAAWRQPVVSRSEQYLLPSAGASSIRYAAGIRTLRGEG